jgi:schlafen family protein
MGRAEDIFERISLEGEAAIDDFILARKSEELFLDFKRSADEGRGDRLHQNDRNNLGRALSGFANSEGGVILWGVDCRREESGADVARCKYPLVDSAGFVSWLESAVSGCTLPACPGVRSISISKSGRAGFAATYVPKSTRAPHQDLAKGGYYIRAGSDFLPAPYGVLAGLFGKRPEPFIFHQLYIEETVQVSPGGSTVDAVIGFILVNDGPGIARDLFLTLDIFHPGGKSSFFMEHTDEAIFDYYHHFGMHLSVISKDGFKLPPGGRIHALTMKVHLVQPFTRDAFYFSVNYGCSGAPTRQRSLTRDSATLDSLCRRIAELPEQERADFITKEFFGELGPGELTERLPMVSER